ncbi:MAG: phosphoadenylyl-sulfate reductase [Ilumatobacteraceae bacterium]|nr:phosphoadenylyl-sulfate reductase [Ilumatobacteraceae bacterium]
MPVATWNKETLADYSSEIAKAAHDLENATPGDIVRWAADRVGGDITVTCSFEDVVLAHVAAVAVPGIEIVMIDTQYLFAETQWLAEEFRKKFDANLRVVHPLQVTPDNLWQRDTEACCNVRKVLPLNAVLAEKSGWVTGVRRIDSPTRTTTPVVSLDVARNVLKVNPLALYSDEEMETYEFLHELPRNPLKDRGYPSIGCWPCTKPVAEGEDKRAGRWAGQEKTECGLHI